MASNSSTAARELAFLLKGNFFAGDWVRTDVSKGVTRNRQGTRLCALTEDFLRGLRRALTDECGPAAIDVEKSFGRRWGKLVAKRLEKEWAEFYGTPVAEFPLGIFTGCMVESFGQHGWGKLHLDYSGHVHGLIVAEIEHALMADMVEPSQQPVEAMLAGLLAGMFTHFSGEELDCVQTDCIACGNLSAKFVLGLSARLVDATDWRQQGMSHEEIVRRLVATRA